MSGIFPDDAGDLVERAPGEHGAHREDEQNGREPGGDLGADLSVGEY
jgi:hypothetical protein